MLRTRSPRKEKISNCYLHSNSLSNKMDNSLLAVRDINHKYIVVERSSIADIYYFPIKAYQILEDVFEWNVSFKPNEESTWIQWKIAKSDWNVNEKRMPEFLSVNADELLFF